MFQASFVRPPRMAVWLVDLFTPNKQSESIPGDLLEEFSELASKSGVASAAGGPGLSVATVLISGVPVDGVSAGLAADADSPSPRA